MYVLSFFLLSIIAVAETTFLDRPDVWKSPCKSKYPTKQTMLNHLEGLRPNKVRSKIIAGAKLKDNEALLKIFGDLHNQDPKYARESWRYARGANVTIPAGCTDVMCAMAALYGEELGLQLLYMRSKFGFNGSHLSNNVGDKWDPRDLEIGLAMLNDFKEILPVNEGSQFVWINAPGRDGHNMVAESFIRVYTGWKKLPESELTTSIAHELGHNFAIGRKESADWLALSDWSSTTLADGKTIKWKMGKPDRAVLEYARTNPDEDFAETFFMYRYNGAQLLERQPEKYAYMKNNVFNGREFIDSASCR